MSLFDMFKKQFIDVIEWVEPEERTLAFRCPMFEKQIQNGAQLTVRESQAALFVNEGKIADLFGAGLHTLNTRNLPLLTNLMNWDKAFHSPFKSDVFFFSQRDQIDQKWGTMNPVTVRDKELGPVRLRANGIYSYRVEDPRVFYQKVSGSRETFLASELEGQLLGAINASLATFLASSQVPFIDMAANQSAFSEALKKVLDPQVAEFGLKLQTFYVQGLTLPEEVQEHLDKVSSMRVIGDLRAYTQFQTADSIAAAAANPGGTAGAGIGLGAGVSMGQAMMQAMGGAAGALAAGSADAAATLEKLHDLLVKGVLTQAEFDAKKAEILKKM
jgi:membrane protease subunit (stomatin/prohibitin family)